MNGVESLGLGLGQLQAFLPDDLEASRFQLLVDRPGQVTPRGVGLNDRKVRSTDIGFSYVFGERIDESRAL